MLQEFPLVRYTPSLSQSLSLFASELETLLAKISHVSCDDRPDIVCLQSGVRILIQNIYPLMFLPDCMSATAQWHQLYRLLSALKVFLCSVLLPADDMRVEYIHAHMMADLHLFRATVANADDIALQLETGVEEITVNEKRLLQVLDRLAHLASNLRALESRFKV